MLHKAVYSCVEEAPTPHPPTLRRPGKYEARRVQQVRLHPGWTLREPRNNNLALLQLAQPATLAPVPLAAGKGVCWGTAVGGVRLCGTGRQALLYQDAPPPILPGGCDTSCGIPSQPLQLGLHTLPT